MRALACTLAAMVLLSMLSACDQANRGGVPSANIVLTTSGMLTVNGSPVRLAEIQDKLKEVGAGRLTSIRVQVPDGTSKETLQRLGSRLASGGYSRVVFAKPRKADVSSKAR